LQARIAFLEQENAEHKAREAAQIGTKKRRAIPNPNRKFMSIHDILSKGGCIKDLKDDHQVEEEAEEEVVVDDKEFKGFSNKEQNAEDKGEIPAEILAETVTRSGRQINRPARYAD
jgi:hypothetical protein